MDTHYDLVIIGGGLVGASLALALAPFSWRIAIVDAQPFASRTPSADRAIALSSGSQKIFKTLGVWQNLEQYTSPIKNIHISDQGRFGALRFSSQEYDLFSFGAVISAHHLLIQLQEKLSQDSSVDLYFSSQLTDVKISDTDVTLQITNADGLHSLKTKLIIAADGSHSTVRACLKLPIVQHDYIQDALVGTINCEFDHQGCAYERMTPYGTLALLPRAPKQQSFVWTMPKRYADHWANADENFLLEQLQNSMGNRLGKFTHLSQRLQFPLHSTHMEQSIHSRVVFIGNAAHTLHPIAAQGFNLGLRDAAVLAEILTEQDFNLEKFLSIYQKSRQQDQNWTRYFTQALVEICSLKTTPFILLRDMGLLLFDFIPGLQQQLVNWGMTGFNIRQPKLACEIPLQEHLMNKEIIYATA